MCKSVTNIHHFIVGIDPNWSKSLINASIKSLRGPGGLHQNSLEIDFIVVSDRGE